MKCRKIFLALMCCAACMQTSAQLCQGSLGDPIVNITFGSGSNPGAPLPGATTNYQYFASDCPDDGYYAVRNSSNACFGNSWHTVSSDHTGNANGYFMIVNASFQPSAFYIDTVDLLCVNTTYEFAAWILNMSKPNGCGGNLILPNLTFRIEQLDGTIIQSYNTNNISPTTNPQWQQFGFLFQTPVNISRVVLRLINNAPGGCGNDVALDDITFRPCGPKITAGAGGGATAVNICQGKDTTVSMTANASGYSNPIYQWQESVNGGSTWTDIPSANSINFTKSFPAGTAPGTYLYRLSAAEALNATVAQCRVSSDVITVVINPNPITTATNNGPACEGNTVTLAATGGSIFAWAGPNNFTSSGSAVALNNIQPNQAGKYRVIVTNSTGCSSLDSTSVIINPKPVITVNTLDANICKGDSVQLIASGAQAYQWSPSTGLSFTNISNPKASPTDSTRYKLIGTNGAGCADSLFIKVNIVSSPAANAGPDKTIVVGLAVTLNGAVSNADSFYWSPPLYISDVYTLHPIVNPPADASFYLHAISKAGCGIAVDTVFIKVYQQLAIPNAFSPNGDGINDTWNIPALQSYPGNEVNVYNRYGQLVFKQNEFRQWDGTRNGKPLPIGTYYYIISLQNGMAPVSGWLTLLR